MSRKVALVTGSTSGIGLGIAHRLAETGYDVIITGLGDQTTIDGILEKLKSSYKGTFHFVHGDLAREEGVAELCCGVMTLYPDGVDVLINNAGIQHVCSVEEYPVATWHNMVAIHMTAPFLLIKHFLPFMKKKGWGRIVNTASQMATISAPWKAPYSATKAGLTGLTRGVALEAATFGVTCNAICPGFVDTDIVRSQAKTKAAARGVTPEQICEELFSSHPSKQPVTIDQVSIVKTYIATMTVDAMTADAMTADQYIEEYQIAKRYELMPVIVIMTIVCVLGIAGNSFTIAFYGFVARKTPTVSLITLLAITDLFVCILIIPQIAEMAVNIKFTSPTACKLIHFFGHWTIMISALTLWFIAIDRYRHVCCPFKTQVSLKGAKWATIVIIIFSLILSARDLANFDIIKFSIESQSDNGSIAIAHFCTTREDPQYRLSVTLFHSIDAVIIAMILVTFFVTYGKIVWTIKKGAFASGTDNKTNYEESIENNENERSVDPTTSDPSTNEGSTTENVKDKTSREDFRNDIGSNAKPIHRSSSKRPDKSITLMMLVVSLMFILCLVPYFIVKIGIRSYKSASQLELGVGVQLVIRFVYVNSFVNPIVFCFFNPQFRRYIKNTCVRLKPGRGQLDLTMSSRAPS